MHHSIDWFSWLSKTSLEPSLIYEYGMAFSRNELEEEDIAFFNHEFLQSMGISIAKHRLEILKLARKQKGSGSNGSHPISKFIIAIKKTKRTLASYIRTWMNRDESSLVLVHKSYGTSRWKGNMLRRSRRLVSFKQANTTTLLLTNGHHMSKSLKVNSVSSPVYDLQETKHDGHDEFFHREEGGGGGDGGGYWPSGGGGVKEIKWDTMFQNLKPT